MEVWSDGGLYVSNYPTWRRRGWEESDRDSGDGLLANPLGGPPYTKFYVYNNAGARVNNADLDGRGAKFIPRLCLICHGGQYVPPNSANQGNMGARFIAFDLESYLYSGFDPAFSRTNQEEEFRKLNRVVLENTNPTPAAQQLIEGWYGGPGGAAITGRTVNDAFVPPGWRGHHQAGTRACTAT